MNWQSERRCRQPFGRRVRSITPDNSDSSQVVDGITQAVELGVDCLREENPRLDAELVMRQGPLRMQYEARGPGLLSGMQRYVPQVNVSGGVTVVCLPPYRPGEIICVPGAAAVLCEAPLTDLTPDLPEVLRLVWGLCGVGTQDRANKKLADLEFAGATGRLDCPAAVGCPIARTGPL